MRRGPGAALILTLCALAVLLSTAPARAKGRNQAASAPPRGWVVDRVRIESLEPEGFVSAPGIGDFRGVLDMVPAGGGVAVVNEVGLDHYVRGISEVPTTWPLEAQRAQAIAARTFALHEMAGSTPTASRAVGAQICATESCQVYVGLAKERQPHGSNWVSAVESTSGQVLLYRGKPILAQYSSSNGGHSVAGSRPYLRAAADPDSARGPYNRWQVRLGYAELAKAFSIPGTLTTLRRTGEAVVLDWSAPDGATGQTAVGVADFRARLNDVFPPQAGLPRTVPSTRFAVAADDAAGAATLNGSGHGHGVGMSQFGALGKAQRGMRCAEILASYYGGLKPTSLPPDQLPSTVRVALDTGRGSVTVGASGRFRVLDGAGSPLAVAANGQWRVVPAGRGRVRVVPPPGQDAAPVVEPMGIDLMGDNEAPEGRARFRLSIPAAVRLRLEGPALPAPFETPMVVTEAGEVAAHFPSLPGPGSYVVSVIADAGAGRLTTASIPLQVSSPEPPQSTTRVDSTFARAARSSGLTAAAWALLISVSTALGALATRRLRPRATE